jgi:sigma-E factor negative regulatory protein RseA
MMAAQRDAAMHSVNLEQLSSLVDGELDRDRAAALIGALCKDADLQRRWAELQLVADALRSSDVAACHVEGFCARVKAALATEPTVLAPLAARASMRRYMLPGAAIAAAVAALTFIAVPLLRSPESTVMAQRPGAAPAPVLTARADTPPSDTKAAAAIASARALDPYYAAHREMAGGTPLPRATAYLRTSGGER